MPQDKSYEIRGGGGVAPTLGSEDFKEIYSLAIHAGGDFAYFIAPQIAVGGNLHYGRFGLDEEAFLDGQSGNLDGGALTGFEILGMVRYYFKPPRCCWFHAILYSRWLRSGGLQAIQHHGYKWEQHI